MTDKLRRGLFHVLEGEAFGLRLRGLGLEAGNRSFHDSGCFFVHAAKVRPVEGDAPPAHIVAYCASRHLRAEIDAMNPGVICLLGTTHLGPTAAALFHRPVGGVAVAVALEDWRGSVVLAPQPVRGAAPRTAVALGQIWRRSLVR